MDEKNGENVWNTKQRRTVKRPQIFPELRNRNVIISSPGPSYVKYVYVCIRLSGASAETAETSRPDCHLRAFPCTSTNLESRPDDAPARFNKIITEVGLPFAVYGGGGTGGRARLL